MNHFREKKFVQSSFYRLSMSLKGKYFYKPPILNYLEAGEYILVLFKEEKNNKFCISLFYSSPYFRHIFRKVHQLGELLQYDFVVFRYN